jgi:Undecaprenyl-phosphate glucose phosphotransferase
VLKQRHQVFAVLLAAADAVMIAGASYAAWAVRVDARGEPLPNSWENWFKHPLVLFTVPIGLYFLWAFGLFRPRRDKSLIGELGQVVKASVVSCAALIVILWVVGNDLISSAGSWDPWWDPIANGAWAPNADPARVQLAAFAVLLPLLLGFHRICFRLTVRALRARGRNLRHAVVIGVGRLGQITCRTLERNSWTGIDISYFVSHHAKNSRTTCSGRRVRGGLDDLETVLEEHPVDAVYLAIPQRHAGCIPDVLKRLERFAIDVRLVPDVAPRYLPGSMSVSELEGMPILSYRECPTNGLGGLSKRCVDVVGATIGLAIFGPLMAIVALLVRLTSPGPIIFKQRRVGMNGETFKIYKFRSMVSDSCDSDDPRWTQPGDARITPLGAILRRTSLDELPQLINVLQGRMSLVGPRPERPELIERFREDWRGYMLRQHVKAGMTGWAQINGLRGNTSLKKRLQYDLYYVRHWSLWLDIRILFITVFRGFIHRNAH